MKKRNLTEGVLDGRGVAGCQREPESFSKGGGFSTRERRGQWPPYFLLKKDVIASWWSRKFGGEGLLRGTSEKGVITQAVRAVVISWPTTREILLAQQGNCGRGGTVDISPALVKGNTNIGGEKENVARSSREKRLHTRE